MKHAVPPSAGKSAGPHRRAFARRAAIAACVVVLAAALAGAAYVAAQSSPPVVATVRHAPTLNGRVEGSVQMLSGEYVNLNTGNVIKGDLLVPGTPAVVINGLLPTYQGTLNGVGNAQPSNYQVTLNTGAEVAHVVRRTNPVTLAPVPLPPAPTGTRYVAVNLPGQSVGTWATVRNLTLNSGVGSYAVPAGTYGAFTANAGGSFVLGVAGATQASVYNFEDLTLNSLANLHVVGPVVVNVANRVSVNSLCVMGSSANPRWLTLNVSRYDVTVNGGELNAVVRAPAGSVNLSAGRLRGTVASDRLNLNLGVLVGVSTDTTAPTVAFTQPAEGHLTRDAGVNVTGTFSDESATAVSVNGVAATISGGTYSAVVPLAEGANTLRAVATDSAGNSSEATRAVTRDSTAPALSVQQPADGAYLAAASATVTGTVADATAAVVKVNGVTADISGNTYSAAVPLAEGGNDLVVTALDAAGNQSEVLRRVTRDTTAPTLTVAQPAEGLLNADQQLTFSGTSSDASPLRVTVAGVEATLNGNSFTATVPLGAGPHLFIARAVDAAGNETTAERRVTGVGALSLRVETPSEGQKTNSREFQVTGAVAGHDVKVTINGQPVEVVGGVFFGGYLNLPEGASTVTVEATDVLGRKQAVTRGVTLDTAPPAVTGISPAQDALVAETTTSLSGRVADASAVTVTVNDVEVTVNADGIFTLPGFAVSEGENAFTVEAVDELGNRSVAQSSFRGKDRTPPPPVSVFSLPAETSLQLLQVEGRAEPGAAVSIVGGEAPVAAEAAEGTGLFFATVKLAAGDNALTVTSADREGNASQPVVLPVRYDPSLTRPAGQPFAIHISTNDGQKGLAGQELPRPLIVRVTDQSGAPVANVPVTFTAAYGGGSFVGGGGQVQSATDAEGRAAARYIGGPEPGFQYVRTDFAGNPTAPVSFSAELLRADPATPTTASGLVLDQNLRALPNVLVRLGGQQVRTGADGRFHLANVPVGPHQVLELIGRDQIQLPGRWPNISYDLDVLPGVDNHLGRPLFLPRVNGGVEMPLDENGVVTRDTVYELPAVGGLPPVRVTARAGTHVQFPPDVTDKRLSVTRIPVNRTPMTLEDGRATNLYISVQPSGAIFEPALEVTFPNVDELAAGSGVLLMSFDHDAGRYVQMGTGHVSADGRVVQSDAGSGIRVGAWHALPPPEPARQATVLGHVQVEGNPALEGRDVEVTEAVVLSTRAVPYSKLTNAAGVLSRVLLRAVVRLPGNAPKAEPMVVQAKATRPEVQIDAGAFDYKTRELFIAENQKIELDAGVVNGLAGSNYTFTCTQPGDAKKATVACAGSKITIEAEPLYTLKNNGEPEFHAGSTDFKVTATGSSGGKAEAKLKLNLVRVKYKEDKANSGFDDPVKGSIQDQTKVQFDTAGKFTGDLFKDDPNNNQNRTKDPWLTVVLNGDQNNPAPGGTQTARYEVEPDKANQFLKFESDATATADVTADTSKKLLTVESKAPAETFLKAKLTSYKATTFEVGRLNVVVRKRVKVPAAFFFLKYDGSHEATLDPGSLNDYVKGINEILTPQTGIQYEVFRVYHWEATKSVNFVPTAANNPSLLKKNFGDVISYADWKEIATGKDAAGNASTQPKLCDQDVFREIYIVWQVEPTDAAPTGVNVVGVHDPATGTIMTDSRSDDTMAHEIGHSLLISPADAQYRYYNCLQGRATCATDSAHTNVRKELMFATNTGRSGLYISKADVDAAVKSVANSDWFKGGWKKRACP